MVNKILFWSGFGTHEISLYSSDYNPNKPFTNMCDLHRPRRPLLAAWDRNAALPPPTLGIRDLRRLRRVIRVLATRGGEQPDAVST